ncbi:MAG: two-component system sensor histidine kinase NtrB [Chlamydiota bacterium]
MPHDHQDTAEAVNQPSKEVAKLTSAFEHFTKEAMRLQDSYKALQEHFQAVDLQLNDANKYLTSILFNIPSGIIFIDERGVITLFNRAAASILGYSKQEALQRSFSEIFSDSCFGFSMEKALHDKQIFSGHHITYELSGAAKELEISTNYVEQEQESYNGIIVVIRDVSEIRHLQTMANRHNRLQELGELAAAMAHEIRNPLGGIRGFASLLSRDLADSPKLKAMADNIVSGTERLDHLVSNVLHYSRRVKLELTTTSLNDLITNLSNLVAADQELTQEVETICKTPENPIYASIDIEMFKGALLNLIVNGAQAIEEEGKVVIALSEDTNHAIVTVSDNGSGIPPDIQEKIFSPFFSTKDHGNGFGLSEVQKCVQAHGGTLEVTSLPGATTFTIKIPKTRSTPCP